MWLSGTRSSEQFFFIGSCVSLDGSVIDWIKGGYAKLGGPKPKDISYSTFARYVPPGERQHSGLSSDWSVRFYRSALPSGTPIIYYVHSGIEWVFVEKPSAYNDDRERMLVEAFDEASM